MSGEGKAALTGVQIKLTLAQVLTMARLLAFFSLVCPQVAPTQPKTMELTQYVPTENTIMAKYLAPVLRDAQPRMKPKIATSLAAVMCQVRSLNCEPKLALTSRQNAGTEFQATYPARGPRISHRNNSRNQIRRTSQDQRDRLVEPKRLDSCWKEVLETVRSKMHVLHEGKQPQLGILGCLLEPVPG
jgi:hypothetical protein